MKSAFKWILSVSFILGLLSFGFVARVQAVSNPSIQPTLSATEVSTPVTTPTHHGHKARKSKLVEDTSTVPGATSTGTESPTPATTAVLHGRNAKNTKSTTDLGLAPQYSPVTTPIVKSEAVATAVPDYEFNAVIITGTKSKLKVLDSPAAVSVVPRSKIDQKNIVYFNDALTDLPGVQVSRVAEGSNSVTLTMRGIPGYDKNLILLDGFDLSQAANRRVFWNRVPSQLVDHVEIVRGPFSALYGHSALGGVVNIITAEPQGQSINLSENWDTTNTRVTSVNFQKKLNDRFAFYFGYEGTTVNGYTSHQFIQAKASSGTASATVTGFVQTTNVTGTTLYNIGETPRTVLNNNNLSGKIYYKISQDHTLSLLVTDTFWDQPTDNQTGELAETWLTDVKTGDRVKSGTVSLAGTGKVIKITESLFLVSPGHNGFFGSYLQYKGKYGEKVHVTGNFTYTGGPYRHSSDSLQTTVTSLTGSDTGDENVGSWEGVGNVQANVDLDHHQLVVGSEYDYINYRKNLTYFPFWGDYSYISLPDTNTQVVGITDALFVQDEWKITPQFSIFPGARLDNWRITKQIMYDQGTSDYDDYPARSKWFFSPKFSAVYRLGENASLRSSVGRAFNPPCANQLIAGGGVTTSAGAYTETNPDLGPEKDTAWEFGGEYTFPTRTTLSSTYFNNLLNDLIYVNQTVDGIYTISQSINAGKAKIYGVETEVKQRLNRFFDANVNYTRVESRFISNDAVPTSIGKRIPYISRDVVNVGLGFNWGNIEFSPSGTYHSKQFTTANNTDTVNGVQGAWDAYTTFSLKVAYKFNGSNVFLGVDNVFNKRFYLTYLNPGRVFSFGARFNIL
jgi:iron complex outermembrane receptor protein